MGVGTNFFTSISSTCAVALTDETGLAFLGKCSGAPPTTANVFAASAIIVRTDTGALYQNTGTSAAPSWTLRATGTAGSSGPTGPIGPTGPTGPAGP